MAQPRPTLRCSHGRSRAPLTSRSCTTPHKRTRPVPQTAGAAQQVRPATGCTCLSPSSARPHPRAGLTHAAAGCHAPCVETTAMPFSPEAASGIVSRFRNARTKRVRWRTNPLATPLVSTQTKRTDRQCGRPAAPKSVSSCAGLTRTIVRRRVTCVEKMTLHFSVV
jgi:hypothetical protein